MTMLEQLAAAFPEQIERIKACANPNYIITGESRNAGYALAQAFHWAITDEGHVYWRDLARTAGWPT